MFDAADGRGADGDTPAGERREERTLRGDRQLVEFAVDGVSFNRVGRDGLEGAETDVERDVGRADALGGELGEKLGREMEAGRRRGDGDLAGAICVDGLVAREILDVMGIVGALDVGRERDFAELVCDDGDRFAGWRGEADER